jgi:hypothetical protein
MEGFAHLGILKPFFLPTASYHGACGHGFIGFKYPNDMVDQR